MRPRRRGTAIGIDAVMSTLRMPPSPARPARRDSVVTVAVFRRDEQARRARHHLLQAQQEQPGIAAVRVHDRELDPMLATDLRRTADQGRLDGSLLGMLFGAAAAGLALGLTAQALGLADSDFAAARIGVVASVVVASLLWFMRHRDEDRSGAAGLVQHALQRGDIVLTVQSTPERARAAADLATRAGGMVNVYE